MGGIIEVRQLSKIYWVHFSSSISFKIRKVTFAMPSTLDIAQLNDNPSPHRIIIVGGGQELVSVSKWPGTLCEEWGLSKADWNFE
jgi:hypothetical protein